MPRLVAFGCSQTYGHGLPDCEDPNLNDTKPSQHAWPYLIDQNCVNLAEPGGSNKLAVYRALKFDWQKDDIGVFVWTYINRSTVIGKQTVNLGTWSSAERCVQTWKHFVATANSTENFCFDAMIYIDYMKSKLTVPNYHFTVDKDLHSYMNFDTVCLDDLQTDTGVDDLHYGLETHGAIARLVSQAIGSNWDGVPE